MRLAVVGPTYPFRGGITHHTTLLVNHLRAAGHEVLFVSFTRQYPQWLYGRSDRDPSQSPLTSEAEYLLDSINPLTWRSTAERIKNWRPDKVLLPWWVPYWAPVWGYLSRAVKRGQPPPELIFLCHNVLPHERSWYDSPAVRVALGAGDRFVVHAQPQADALRELFPDRPVIVTPHPTYAPLATESMTLPVALPDDRPLLLFCGLVRHYKGLDILIDSLPQILEQQPVHLAIVGEFWDDEAGYREQIAHLGLEDQVTLVNEYVSNEVLAAFVRRADLVVLPYREATQSGVLQLAFGQETPVVTTSVGGLPEIVADGRTGLLVEPENPSALAAGINQLLGDAQLMSAMRTAIQQENQQRFGWGQLVDVIIAP